MSIIGLTQPRETPRRALQIKMVALDDYFRPGERVDLIRSIFRATNCMPCKEQSAFWKKIRKIQLCLEFWPYGLKQAGAEWGALIEMLQGLGMDIMLIGADGLIPFDARAVRSDVGWYVNLFASRNAGSLG